MLASWRCPHCDRYHLAHYHITASIGAGGMGVVYRATDSRLGREVALKVLPAGLAGSPDRLERFRPEARALAALDHPGIVTVHFPTKRFGTGLPRPQSTPAGSQIVVCSELKSLGGANGKDKKAVSAFVGMMPRP